LTRRYFRINSEQSVSVHCRPTEYYRYYCFGGHVYEEVIERDKKAKIHIINYLSYTLTSHKFHVHCTNEAKGQIVYNVVSDKIKTIPTPNNAHPYRSIDRHGRCQAPVSKKQIQPRQKKINNIINKTNLKMIIIVLGISI